MASASVIISMPSGAEMATFGAVATTPGDHLRGYAKRPPTTADEARVMLVMRDRRPNRTQTKAKA